MKLGIAKLALGAGTLVLLVGMIALVAVAQELPPAPPGDAFDSGSSGGGATKPNAGGAGTGSQTVIAAGDTAAFLANLDGIAKGTTLVR